jgi:hypothetical protein
VIPLAKPDTVPTLNLPSCPGSSRLVDFVVRNNQLVFAGSCHYDPEDKEGTANGARKIRGVPDADE